MSYLARHPKSVVAAAVIVAIVITGRLTVFDTLRVVSDSMVPTVCMREGQCNAATPLLRTSTSIAPHPRG